MGRFVIFGAGKIARGFIGQLLSLSGHPFVLVDKSKELVGLINQRGAYTVNVLGAPEKNTSVRAEALGLDEKERVIEEIARSDGVFTAVGGKNLYAISGILADGLEKNGRPINVITCENWKEPAKLLERAVREKYPEIRAGFAEAVVMRSAIEPTPDQLSADPLTVNVQDYWELPVDAGALRGPLPDILGIRAVGDFSGFLERKFYTYNAANATVSYVGALLGYTHICEAARDGRIAELLSRVYGETGRALTKKYGIPEREQAKFAQSSLRKLQDPAIVDTLERNARDPMRKLGPEDRLVGSARLCEAFGIKPEALSLSIAAALHYKNPGDPSAAALDSMMAQGGADAVLENVCKITRESALYDLVKRSEKELKDKGWIQSF